MRLAEAPPNKPMKLTDDVAAGSSEVTSRHRLGGDLAAYWQAVSRTGNEIITTTT